MPDLRILFGSAPDGGYRAQLADAEGTTLGVEVPFTPFLDRRRLRGPALVPGRLHGPARRRRGRPGASAIEGNLDDWGRRLHDALFTAPENRALLKQLLDGPEPRELTIATQDPDAAAAALGADGRRRGQPRAARVGAPAVGGRRRRPRRARRSSPCASSTSSAGRPMRASSIRGSRRRRSSTPSIRSAPACASTSAVRPPWRAWRRCCATGSGPATRTTSSTSTATAPSCRRRRSARSASRSPTTAPATRQTDLVAADRLGDLLASYHDSARRPGSVPQRHGGQDRRLPLRRAAPDPGGRGQRALDGPCRPRRGRAAAARPLLPRAGPRHHHRPGRGRGAQGAALHAGPLDRIRPRRTHHRAGGLVPAAPLPARRRTTRSSRPMPPGSSRCGSSTSS